ncbi:helix-turn-helix transcriptional regulator [Bradyrhizobium sp. 215_C5_N1_1]|uniref:helix-turn-helix transcriptional regulator n=1 Tax=unclassified Bradyrhizobium TaxID=2631580 RepID=UPI003F8A6AE3
MSINAELGNDIEGDRVLSFAEWHELNGFSRATAQRLMASGKGPRFIKLSERRIGVTVAENRRWQASRQIEIAA